MYQWRLLSTHNLLVNQAYGETQTAAVYRRAIATQNWAVNRYTIETHGSIVGRYKIVARHKEAYRSHKVTQWRVVNHMKIINPK